MLAHLKITAFTIEHSGKQQKITSCSSKNPDPLSNTPAASVITTPVKMLWAEWNCCGLSENISGRPRGVAEQQGADWAGRDVGGECRFVHWCLENFEGFWRIFFIDVLNILKVRGARLLKEMVKPEENDTEAVLNDPDWLWDFPEAHFTILWILKWN